MAKLGYIVETWRVPAGVTINYLVSAKYNPKGWTPGCHVKTTNNKAEASLFSKDQLDEYKLNFSELIRNFNTDAGTRTWTWEPATEN